ncbi:MAG: hypothetical protein LBD46_04585 [Endomicrobium sp.]|nr:hypothetical protein [Endomicrobium sp.]
MKKILAAVLCMVFAVSSTFALTILPKVGADISGTMNHEKEPDKETKLGFTVGAEMRGKISNYFGWGAGLEYALPRGFAKINGDNDFSFLPVYISLLFYPLGEWDNVRPYIKANAGYSIFATTETDGDISGNIYLSAGIGTEYENFIAEVMASTYDGEYDGMWISYQKIGVIFGYKFNIFSNSEWEEE